METHDEEHNDAPRGNQLARTDFSGTSLSTGSASSDALIAKATADIQARWIMAMRRPRNMDNVRQMVLKECRRPGFAEAAVYSVPRGDTKIEGLSIRFAEVAVRCMGNLQPEVVTIYDDTDTRIVRCTVTDYESNVTWSKDISIRKTVERKFLKKGQRPLGERVNSYGDRVYIVEATDDDVNTKEAAQVSKALRTLILRCIPGHLQDEALAVCNKVYADKAAKDPDGERIKMLDVFAGIGVMPSEIEELIGHTTERMSPAELDRLRKLFAGINDGHTTIAEAIDVAKTERAKATAAQPAPAVAPTTSAPAAAQATSAAPAPAQATAQPAAPAAKPPAKSGKGTAGLKSALGGNPDSSFAQAAEQARAKDAAREAEPAKPKGNPEDEPGWMSGKKEPEPDAAGDVEERACADCGVPIDVPKDTPAGAKCYACRQA